MNDELTYFCLDWERLSKSPEHAIIVRLMLALNDANSFPFLFGLTEQCLRERSDLDHYIAGVNSYLQRLRVSHITEAIKNTVQMVKIKEAEAPRGAIWKLMRKSKTIRKHFRVLEDYLPDSKGSAPGKHFPHLAPYVKLRNQVTFHYDHDPSKQVIELMIQKHIAEIRRMDKKHSARGLIVDGCGSDGQIGHFLRFLAVDDSLYTRWRDALGIPLRRSYASCRKSRTAQRHLERFLRSFHLFCFELIHAYWKEYDVLLPMNAANRALVDPIAPSRT